MRLTSKIIPIAAISLTLAACGSSGAGAPLSHASGTSGVWRSRPTAIYKIALSGHGETPTGAPHGRGEAIIAFHGPSVVCWRFAHLHGFTNATFAHIQRGAARASGRIVVSSTGPRLHHEGCTTVSRAVSRAIIVAPNHYYVNIDSLRYPAGAVRGQL